MKDTSIILRVESAAKERIANAARLAGKNITNFVLEATMKQVERVESAVPKPGRAGHCPTWFRASCATATGGGGDGYRAVGYQLAVVMAAEEGEWNDRQGELKRALDGEGDDEPIVWFERNLPRFIALVPQRRRAIFIEGVRRRITAGAVGLTSIDPSPSRRRSA